ncbi:MAG TPA: hypothetical protein P5306_08130, partial [Kiritimatiellia bacterium]|nr:hypothetical protein [Kiritimatiellia bacterium]
LLVRFIAHRREDLERLVEQRASDLASMMRRYDQLSHHSRTITWELDADGASPMFPAWPARSGDTPRTT